MLGRVRVKEPEEETNQDLVFYFSLQGRRGSVRTPSGCAERRKNDRGKQGWK